MCKMSREVGHFEIDDVYLYFNKYILRAPFYNYKSVQTP